MAVLPIMEIASARGRYAPRVVHLLGKVAELVDPR
jgi:hypothetical protein